MKRRHTLALAALPLWTGAFGAAAPADGPAVAWPEVALLDGSRFGAAQAAGRTVVVVFWSTTCPFCRRHNQHIEKLHRAAAAGRTLVVLGVARERDAAAVARYAAQQGYSFPLTLDHAPLAAALGARRLIRLTVVVDRLGRRGSVIPGEMFEEDVMELLQLADKEART